MVDGAEESVIIFQADEIVAWTDEDTVPKEDAEKIRRYKELLGEGPFKIVRVTSLTEEDTRQFSARHEQFLTIRTTEEKERTLSAFWFVKVENAAD